MKKLVCFVVCVLMALGSVISLAQGELLYEYVKVAEIEPRDFSLALMPESVVPIQKIIKYDKRMNVTQTVGEGQATRTYNRGDTLYSEYRALYELDGRPCETLIYMDRPEGGTTSLVSSAWIKAYNAIKQYTEPDALILCWWPHAKRIRLFTGRQTIISAPSQELLNQVEVPEYWRSYRDSIIDYESRWIREKEGFEADDRVIDVARIFCSPEGTAVEILRKYNTENKPVYILVTQEDFQEIENINNLCKGGIKIGSTNFKKVAGTLHQDIMYVNTWLTSKSINTYFAQIHSGYYTVWYLEDKDDPEMKEKLIAKLLPFNTGHGRGLKYFVPKFVGEEAYVWVYMLKTA